MNILCFGDSNTWGYKPDKTGRFDENTRWTALLQKKLDPEYHIIEEGLCGRTTVFQDELRESRRGLVLRFQKPAGLREKFFAGKQDVERLQQRVCAPAMVHPPV